MCGCGKRRELCTKCIFSGWGLCDKHQKRWDKCKECSQPSDAQADGEPVGEPVEQPVAVTPPSNARGMGSAHREVDNMVPELYM